MIVQTLESPLGPLSAAWTEQGLYRLTFGRLDTQHTESDLVQLEPQAAAERPLPPNVRAGQRGLQTSLNEYFKKRGSIEFALEHLDWSGVPQFHRRVLLECARIERGETLTYGRLAEACGSPGAARAVGQAMARNRWPLIIPCHRVVGHSGKLTGYSGLGGTATKRRLLDFEQGLTTSLFDETSNCLVALS